MSNQSLNQQISQQISALTAALKQTTSADATTREQLHALQQEITRITEHHVPVTERLEEIAVKFEADHPAVGTALREAINALSKAGI